METKIAESVIKLNGSGVQAYDAQHLTRATHVVMFAWNFDADQPFVP
jgi:hypothetical protein